MSTQNLIQIKRSETTQTPPSLANGELAWSSNGNVLFIGDFGTVRSIGGENIIGSNEIDVSYAANGQVTIGLANTVDFSDITIDSVTLSSYTLDGVIDDDTMATASNTTVATSESIKAYVDAQLVSGISSIDNISDVDTTGKAQGDVLGWDGSSWVDYDIIGDTGITVTANSTAINVDLDDTAVTPGSYGNATHVSSVTVDQQGRLTAASDTQIAIPSSALTTDVALGTQTSGDYVASFTAGDGLTGDATGEGSTPTIDVGAGDGISVNATAVAVAANTSAGLVASAGSLDIKLGNGLTFDGSGNVAISSGDNVTFGDVQIEGDLTVTGNVISLEVTEFKVEDPLIHLGSNNVADSIDLGFVGRYSDDAGVTIEHAGLFRDADDEKFHLFKNLIDPNLDNGATTVDKNGTGYARADLVVGNLEGLDATLEDVSANTLSLTNDLEVAHGGTGKSSVTTNAILYGQGTSALAEATGSAYQVLQMNASGVPVFDSLDGGTF